MSYLVLANILNAPLTKGNSAREGGPGAIASAAVACTSEHPAVWPGVALRLHLLVPVAATRARRRRVLGRRPAEHPDHPAAPGADVLDEHLRHPRGLALL